MKTITFLFFSLFFFSFTVLHSQSKAKKSDDVILVFDYSTKQWSYKSANGREKPYFVIKYKTQPVIQVTNLPYSNSIVEIDGQYYDVTPSLDSSSVSILEDEKIYKTTYSVTKTMSMVDSDEIIYSVSIKNSSDSILHTTEAFAKVYGRIKIDLSTGILFHTLTDESYYFSDAGNDQSSISKDESQGSLTPLFPVVITHVYWQSKGYFSFGASLGLGIDDSGKAGYYLGPSFLFGDRQRAILSAGWALRPTDVLKGKYEIGQEIHSSNLPETSELVHSVYKSGLFFSLTYNLSSKVEKR